VGCASPQTDGVAPEPEDSTTMVPSSSPQRAGTGSVPVARKELQSDAFKAELTRTICEASAGCCASGGASYNPEVCNKANDEMWNNAFKDLSGYDGVAAARCLEAVKPLATSCNAEIQKVLELADCRVALRGPKLLATGAACKGSLDCALVKNGRAFCWTGPKGDQAGRCAVETPPAAGKGCAHPQGAPPSDLLELSKCSADASLRCDPKTSQCVPKVPVGGECAFDECAAPATCRDKRCKAMSGKACKSTNECGYDLRCVAEKCVPGGKLGEACAGGMDCVGDLFCAPHSKKCSNWAATMLCTK